MTNPGAPALPLEINDVSVAGQVLRGVGFRGGSFTDTTGVTPLTGAPATELNSPHSPFVSAAFFPAGCGASTTSAACRTPARARS